jgi:2,4-dienoyl-CoA reductase-like NADH-dependent reductase (Old Yellow Enzyme family)
VGVGRQALADHHFARKILQGQAADVRYCGACQGCFKLVCHQEPAGCTSHEDRYKQLLRQISKKSKK